MTASQKNISAKARQTPEVAVGIATPEEAEILAEMSRAFEAENCCNGIVADCKEFFASREIYVARVGGKPVGYCYGTLETKEKKSSLFDAGELCFYLDEIYVSPPYRSLGIGQKLLAYAENKAKEKGCSLLSVTAVNKDYRKILHFYTEEIGMTFWHAALVKHI